MPDDDDDDDARCARCVDEAQFGVISDDEIQPGVHRLKEPPNEYVCAEHYAMIYPDDPPLDNHESSGWSVAGGRPQELHTFERYWQG